MGQDIVVESILLLVIALAHILQTSRLFNVGSAYAISPYILLFNTLYSNPQLALTLLLTARAWPNDRSPVLELTGSGKLRGAQALGAVLGIVQVALQWVCLMVLLTLSAAFPLDSANLPRITTTRTIIPAIAFILAALFLFPAAIALRKPSPNDIGIDIFTGFSVVFNTGISLAFVILQFYPQLLEFQRIYGSPGSLSLLSLGIRAAVMIAVAVRWFQTLGAPTWEGHSAPLTMWYQWGFLPFNYIIEGIGCAVLVGMYVRAGKVGGTLNIAGEESPLLT